MAKRRTKEYVSKDFILHLLEYYGRMETWSKKDVLDEIKLHIMKEVPIVMPVTLNCKECIHIRRTGKTLHGSRCWCELKDAPTSSTDCCPYGRKMDEEMDLSEKNIDELLDDLAKYDDELEYQVNHKRIAYLQEKIAEIEAELNKRNEAEKANERNS